MAPSAIDYSDQIITPPIPVLKSSLEPSDFRAELREKGFCVIKGAIPKDRANDYQHKAHDWLLSFGKGLKLEDPQTWTESNLPLTNKIRVYHGYCVAHEKFMWDARMEPGVLDAFSRLWGTDELLKGMGALDQSPMKRGVHCVQGIINLSPNGPEDGGLVVYPGSHKLDDEFFDTHPDVALLPNNKDVYLFSKEELAWFEDRGLRPHKVCADVGDLIMWDSRVIHYGSDPTPLGNTQLALKKNKFEHFGSTTHWPYEHITAGPTYAILPDGTRDPQDRDEPLEKPELTDKLLKLAVARPY
ncbi:phytanoyl- dioxygenase [Colletotrichum asianum]|uniref:Phytanoyl- dioxygenase n=1 Tax=Colletotrichum asianum TaxID=702518 RepID=A0A8H3WCW9_9PEZI|nr:phytanoyl- dioxygenase [Colletotrichum asianum]